MKRSWTLATLGLAVVLGAFRLYVLETRMLDLERRPSTDPQQVDVLRGELGKVRRQLADSQSRLEAVSAETEHLGMIREAVQVTSQRVDEQGLQLADWRSMQDEIGPQAVERRLAEFSRGFEERWQNLQTLATSALGRAEDNRSQLSELEHSLLRDHQVMWSELVGPVVQLAGESTVGSGVLLRSTPVTGKEGEFDTWLITSWHVVRDIQTGSDDVPIPVTIYDPSGRTGAETAKLIEFDAAIDVALLKLETSEAMAYGARLASRSELAEVDIFEPIYAVGCPLGNDPIPTFGEVASINHVVDGDRYWMISAPTYVGNSGGGIYTADSKRLLGIFSKIYTHGTLRPTVVPHMGLVTPLETIYEWLDSVGYGYLESEEPSARVASMSSSD